MENPPNPPVDHAAQAAGGPAAATPRDDGPPMSASWIRFFGFYHMFLSLALIILLIKIWPDKIPPAENALHRIDLFFGRLAFAVHYELQVMLIVIFAGALGSYVHAATSFVNFTGARKIVDSWRWWYILRPFVGSALALGFYFTVRAGFFASNGSGGPASFNLVGFAAASFLVGMFTRQAVEKLRELFDTLFKTTPPTDKDKLH